jgi:hypothetical protein
MRARHDATSSRVRGSRRRRGERREDDTEAATAALLTAPAGAERVAAKGDTEDADGRGGGGGSEAPFPFAPAAAPLCEDRTPKAFQKMSGGVCKDDDAEARPAVAAAAAASTKERKEEDTTRTRGIGDAPAAATVIPPAENTQLPALSNDACEGIAAPALVLPTAITPNLSFAYARTRRHTMSLASNAEMRHVARGVQLPEEEEEEEGEDAEMRGRA